MIRLAPADFKRLLDMIANPPKPNAKLIELMRR